MRQIRADKAPNDRMLSAFWEQKNAAWEGRSTTCSFNSSHTPTSSFILFHWVSGAPTPQKPCSAKHTRNINIRSKRTRASFADETPPLLGAGGEHRTLEDNVVYTAWHCPSKLPYLSLSKKQYGFLSLPQSSMQINKNDGDNSWKKRLAVASLEVRSPYCPPRRGRCGTVGF